jgi:serine/threonine-protein kinase
MGSVYKAFDPTLQRTVAVKTVRPDLERPDFLDRLTREAQACARLRHPNVVTVYEAGEIDGLVYIVMEFLQGADLGTVLRRGDLTFEAKIKILIQILDALEHTHRESVIHRDIKPSNVHVQPDGSIKVVDFGLARLTEISALTHTGEVMGTPDYASPEQLRGDRVDHRTDIYSTGALAYELFAGRRPFRIDSDTDSVGALILRVMSAPLPPMDVMWTRKFPDIERIVARAMARDPRDRYQTAEDMRNALAAFMASSRDAIAATQAEVSARDRRTVIEAQTMIAKGMAAEAQTLLAQTLQSNPDADGVRRLLGATRLANGTATTAPGPNPPPQPAPESTVRPSDISPSRATTVETHSFALNTKWIVTGAATATIVIVALLWRPEQGRPPSSSGSPSVAATGVASSVESHATTVPTSTAPSSNASPNREKPAAGGPPPSVAAAAPSPDSSAPTPPGATTPHEVSAKELFGAKSDGNGGGANPGLRFRLIRLADGQQTEVDPATTTFHSGDRVRFAFDSNVDGYLYVVQQGSSGRWTVLFPGSQINSGRNAVKRAEEYDVPNGDWFRFDSTPGTENVFVFLSRDPMDQLPGFDRPVTRTETVAASVVEDLQHRVRSRDLVFEKDSQSSEGGGQSQATYVVNRAELGQAVAASITLNHQ